MLKKINEGGVESDQGFAIQIVGPEIMRYTYKNYILDLGISYDLKNRKAYIYVSDAVDWNDGGKKVRISADNKNLIIQNIKDAVQLLTGSFEVV
ncbi:MAG: hypothetical protein UR27_C0004G0003 [Candidatus Peregrinibacteria bacterium GW2011_GWA2_33_10]|nr:MAG: hypothetical protein UR27_C0004G0003 [Candidatus Peregrinibacteria bacterium GW2011_GWA2_33_10]OGT26077.1 MAG: hypothetical protein A3B71_04250 [Gammaproteobacteria bacterium RIFCSPHIGHO2_02_FULL_42_43]